MLGKLTRNSKYRGWALVLIAVVPTVLLRDFFHFLGINGNDTWLATAGRASSRNSTAPPRTANDRYATAVAARSRMSVAVEPSSVRSESFTPPDACPMLNVNAPEIGCESADTARHATVYVPVAS